MTNKPVSFTIGADPELFLKSIEGKYISSIGKIGGTKAHPRPIGNDCMVQEDNVAVEFNIPPAESYTAFKNSLLYSLSMLEERAKSLNLVLAIEASAEFDPDQLTSPAAKRFGCEPDFNAWTGAMNPRPDSVNKELRSCGGHVHVGTDKDIVDVVRSMDLFLGVPATIIDTDVRRRQLYGKAGAYRAATKFNGGEYRTLSNFWLKSEFLMQWVYAQTQKALEFVEENTKDGKLSWDIDVSNAIQNCINLGDMDAYAMLETRYKF